MFQLSRYRRSSDEGSSPVVLEGFRLDGKVAVVTGAGHGIGAATALALAGYNQITVPDSIFWSEQVSSAYPYTGDGARMWTEATPFLDPLTLPGGATPGARAPSSTACGRTASWSACGRSGRSTG